MLTVTLFSIIMRTVVRLRIGLNTLLNKTISVRSYLFS